MAPVYDFRCDAGHVTEEVTDRAQRSGVCPQCGSASQRVAVYPGHVPGVNGIVTVPMAERGIPLGRALEAHDTIVHQAERAGVEPPDTLSIAKRVAKGIQKHRPDLIG